MKGIVSTFIILFTCYILMSHVVPRIFAVFSETPNVTVKLQNCNSNCILKGTLKANPISLERYLIDDKGTHIYLMDDNIAFMSWPIPENEKDKE